MPRHPLPLPARHVHLDFHTSEHIPGVGSRFDPTQFKQALKLGKIDHLTVFAKCHHSWSYYPTTAGRVHPTLRLPDGSTDLLGRMLDACHDIGVRAPIYITVGWSANDALRHPEWHCRQLDGSSWTTNLDHQAKPDSPRPLCSWQNLCVNTAYRGLILEQTRELCARYRVDGIFYDICFFPRCYCDTCKSQMLQQGIALDDSPASLRAATEFYDRVWTRFFFDCRQLIHQHHPRATVFFNGRASLLTPDEHLDLQTHYELEDLPTTWGGYDKFAPRARFFLTRDLPPEPGDSAPDSAPPTQPRSPKPVLAMSGKFHTSWGEFGGFKHPDAIRFEAASMIAYGATCSFGDQLHPLGHMDPATYRNIGKAYDYVKKIENYGPGALPYSTLGIVPTDAYLARRTAGRDNPADQGVVNMVMESGRDFEIVHRSRLAHPDRLARCDTLVLTGAAALTGDEANILSDYVAGGGSLLVLAESALDADRKQVLFNLPLDYQGPARYADDYLVPLGPLAKGVCSQDSPLLCYSAAPRFTLSRRPGASAPGRRGPTPTILAHIKEPYFDRTYAAYCSHMNTANRPDPAEHLGAVRAGRIVHLAHPLGLLYARHGARAHRDIFLNALSMLHKRPAVRADLPSAGRVSLLHQPDHHRYALHLLYAPPLQRGRCLIIEDLPELRDLAVELRLPHKIRRATLPVHQQSLALTRRPAGRLRLTLPRLHCHELIALEY